MKCATCRNFSEHANTPHCRLNPPTALGDGNNSAFPLVIPEQTWCAQHRLSVLKWLRRVWAKPAKRTRPLSGEA